jgi:hypothetical protein
LAEEHEGKVEFVGVSNHDTVAAGERYVKEFEVPYPMGHAPDVWELYDVPYQPVTIVIAADGSIAERIIGPVTYDSLADAIADVL